MRIQVARSGLWVPDRRVIVPPWYRRRAPRRYPFPHRLAFPTVAGETGDIRLTSSTTQNVILPTPIDAGDLLLIFLATDGAPTYTWPSGWNQAGNNLFSVASGTAVKMEGKQRVADGSEDGGTVAVTTSASEAMAYVTVRITGWHGTTPAEAATASNTTKPDPPSLNPTGWDAEDTLWFCVGCTDTGGTDNDDISAISANYTLVDTLQNSGTDAGGVNLGVGRRNLNAASEDPGVYTTATNEDTCAATVAVRPAAAAAGFVRPKLVTAQQAVTRSLTR